MLIKELMSTGYLSAATFIEIHYFCHIGGCLFAAEISVFTYRVIIVFGIGFHKYGIGHVAVPYPCIFAVFPGKRYSVIYMGYA